MLKLQTASLDWALQHALNRGDTTLFPHAFEFQAIEHDWVAVRSYLEGVDLDTWAVRPHRQCLAPKGRYAFRATTQLDPLDFILYTALVYEMGHEIESSRVATARNVVFSYRFRPEPTGRMFASDVGYPEFLERTKVLSDGQGVSHIAIADIADFYPRIYHHPLENALATSTGMADHVRCTQKLLSGWSASVSHGLPVGNSSSRLLAEIAISGVDEGLLAAGVSFIRFNDDYRIFATSATEAYRHLALLANQLYEVHGLTLQPSKTGVMPKGEFVQRFLREPQDRELDELKERFQEFLKEIGVADQYAKVEYNDLDPAQKELVDGLNLVALFRAEAAENEPDLAVLRFVLRRMAQLGDRDLVAPIMEHIESIHPVVPDIVKYLSELRHLSPAERSAIGAQWLDLLEDSVLSELEYHRTWALAVFASGTDWNNEQRLVPLLGVLTDAYSRRKIVLALGRAHAQHWFVAQRRNLFNEPPWVRRAFIAGASCMAQDQRRHWYRSISARLDVLETAVMKWVSDKPF